MCGRGKIFASLLRLRHACPACGWVVEREPGTVTGSMYLVSVLTLPFSVLVFLVLWLLTDWPPWLQVAVGAPVVAAFSLPALWVSRSVWAAVEYLTDVKTGEASRDDYRERAYRLKR